MICDNTFSTGFYFWLGKTAAEIVFTFGVLAVFAVIVLIATSRKR